LEVAKERMGHEKETSHTVASVTTTEIVVRATELITTSCQQAPFTTFTK
jgi:hypothetical protein